MKFQKGDTVKVIAGEKRLIKIGIFNQLFHGLRGEIKVVDKNAPKLRYCVNFPKIDDLWFAKQDLELVEHKEVATQPETDTKLFGHPRFYEILKDMADLHSRKNHDYAGTSDPLKNLRACTRIDLEPFMGVLVRLQDKWSRLEEFVKSGKLMVKNESVIDTLMDNAVYSVLAIILYEEQLKREKNNVAG